jgi:chromosome condensin MukBEF MukE localization factor
MTLKQVRLPGKFNWLGREGSNLRIAESKSVIREGARKRNPDRLTKVGRRLARGRDATTVGMTAHLHPFAADLATSALNLFTSGVSSATVIVPVA